MGHFFGNPNGFPGMPFPNPGDVVELQAWQGEIWEARLWESTLAVWSLNIPPYALDKHPIHHDDVTCSVSLVFVCIYAWNPK